MGKTGYTSAVGLSIESAFRNVPLSGSNPYSVGVPGTKPLRYCIVEPSAGIQGDPQIDSGDEVDGDIQQRRNTLTGKKYDGDLSLKLDPENGYYLLLGMFGRDIQTTLQAAGAGVGAFQHVFLPGKNVPSFTLEEDIADGLAGRLSSGVIVTRLELTFGKVLTIKATLTGHRQIPNSYPAPSGIETDYVFGSTPALLPSQMGGDGTKQVVRTVNPIYVDVAAGQQGDGPLVFAGATFGTQSGFAPGTPAGFAGAFLTIDDQPVNVEIYEGSTLIIDRKVDNRLIAGSGFDPGSPTGNKFAVTGKLNILYQDMTLPAAALGFKKVGLNLRFVGAQIGTTGQFYSLEAHIPHLKLTKAPVGETGGPVLIASDFVTRRDDTLDYAVKVTLQNSFDATAGPLAGQYVPPAVVTQTIANNTSQSVTVNTSLGFAVNDQVTILGATSNPYTVQSIPDGTHLTFSTDIQALNGPVPAGASLQKVNGTYGPGGMGGWQNS